MSKYRVIYDLPDFPIKKDEGGLYSILPFERLDKDKKAVFKVGLADSFDKRFEGYHTDFPLGFYYKNLLASPTKGIREFQTDTRGLKLSQDAKRNLRTNDRKRYYRKIETAIFKDIEDHGGDRVKSTTRIRNADENGGDTEWFYTDEKTLDDAFKNAYKIYGGRNLQNSLSHINRTATKNKREATYTGEIHFKVFA
jgi:hypothetical protein